MKKIILILILSISTFVYAEYLPQNKAINLLRQAKAKDYPEADIGLVYNDLVNLNDNGKGYEIEEEYKKILNQGGRKENKLYFSYDTNYDSLSVLEIKIFKNDGTVVKLNPNDIMIKRDINSSWSNIYSYSSKILVGTLPDLEIGDIVYTKSKTKIFKTPIEKSYMTRFRIENYQKYLHKYLEINVPSSMKLYIHDINNKGFKYEKSIVTDNKKTVYSFTVKDAPMIIYEPNMDTYNLIAHHLTITSIKNWKFISRWYYNLVEKHLQTDKTINDKVKELTAGISDREEKIKKLFYWVAKKIRYLGVDKEKDRPGFEPHDVTFTFKTRGGVCRDKAALLVAMLRQAGINANVILVNVGNILDDVAPVTWFNHAIVMAYDENGKPKYFLDPTDENTKDFLPTYEEDSSYLVASLTGDSLGIIPVSPPDRNNLTLKIENIINEDNSTTTKLTYTLKGLFDNFIRSSFVTYTKQDYDNYFSKLVKNYNSGAVLTSYTHSDPNDKSKNISFQVNLKIDSFVTESKPYLFIPFDLTKLNILSMNMFQYYFMSPFKLTDRKYNFAMPLTFSFDISEKYEFKKDIKNPILPTIEHLDYKGFKAYLTQKKSPNELFVKYHLESSKKHFKKEDYLPLKRKLAVLDKYQGLYIIAKESK